ncbi:MAG: phosphoribosyltransferase family protein [Pseudomonadota bacterium]
MGIFRNREDAGRKLAPLVEKYHDDRPIVVALPRGGVVVGEEIARAIEVPLEILVVRKIGAPLQPELGMGAVAEGNVRLFDSRVVDEVGASNEDIERIVAEENAEVARRVRRYRRGRPPRDLTARTVLLVDDGIATGGTARAAIRALRTLGAGRVIVAVPVAAAETIGHIAAEADEVVCLATPQSLWAIGYWYDDFGQVSDQEVVELLERARQREASQAREEMPVAKLAAQEVEEKAVAVRAATVTDPT